MLNSLINKWKIEAQKEHRALKQERPVVYHNTHCRVINNETSDEFFVIDGEDPARTVTIPANGSAGFDGTIFPWCETRDDIREKAFRFSRAGVGAFYMFQKGAFNPVYWTAYNGGNPSLEQSKSAGASISTSVDVTIQADGTPKAVTVEDTL